MSRLRKLYQALETLQNEGLELSPEQESKLRKAEEEIIQKEILPVLSERIEPVLSQIEREIVLVVDYVPGNPLRVSLSRRRNVSEVLSDAVEILPDPQVDHTTYGPRRSSSKKAGKTLLRVTMNDGTIVSHDSAKDTFVEVIRRIGVERVRTLNIKFCKVPLVSNTRDSKYGKAQVEVDGSWLILTHSATTHKKSMLEQIAQRLNLDMLVEII